jgi:hypothetical protein
VIHFYSPIKYKLKVHSKISCKVIKTSYQKIYPTCNTVMQQIGEIKPEPALLKPPGIRIVTL